MKFSLKQLLLSFLLIGLFMGLVNEQRRTPFQQEFVSVCFSPGAEWIAVQGTHNTQVFEVDSGRKIAEFPVYNFAGFAHLQFVDREHLLAFGSTGQGTKSGVHWYNVKSQKEVRSFSFARNEFTEHFTPGHEGFLYSDNQKQTLNYYSNQVNLKSPLFSGPAFSVKADNSLYHSLAQDTSFYNGQLKNLEQPEPNFSDTELDAISEEPGPKVRLGRYAGLARYSPDFQFLFVQKESGRAVFQMPAGELIKQWNLKPANSSLSEPIYFPQVAVRFSPNSQFLVTRQNSPCEIEVVETNTGNLLGCWERGDDVVNSEAVLAFAVSDQGHVAFGSSTQDGIELIDSLNPTQAKIIGRLDRNSWIYKSIIFSLGFAGWAWFWSRLPGRTATKPLFRYAPAIRLLLAFAGVGIVCAFNLRLADIINQQRWSSLWFFFFSSVAGIGFGLSSMIKDFRWIYPPNSNEYLETARNEKASTD